MPVAPFLRTQPLYRVMDSPSFTCSSIIEAPAGKFGPEYAGLCQSVAMRNEISEDEFASSSGDDVGWIGFVSGLTIGELWPNYRNHWDFLSFQSVVWKPVREVYCGLSRSSFPNITGIYFNEGFLNIKGMVRTWLE